MLPAVTEVVQVGQPIPRRAENLIQADAVLANALVALFLVELGDEVRPDVALPDARLEAVQMRIGPAHRSLEERVHHVQRDIARQRQTPPDPGLGAPELDGEREQARLVRGRREVDLAVARTKLPSGPRRPVNAPLATCCVSAMSSSLLRLATQALSATGSVGTGRNSVTEPVNQPSRSAHQRMPIGRPNPHSPSTTHRASDSPQEATDATEHHRIASEAAGRPPER